MTLEAWLTPDTGASTLGALIPDGYAEDSIPKKGWVCPVATCRRHHVSLLELGAHFTVGLVLTCLFFFFFPSSLPRGTL